MTTRITTDNITDATIGTADIASSVPLNTQWQSVVTADGSTATTASAGEGYFIDTTSAAHTINLPSSPTQGDEVTIVDYAGTFGSNAVTVGRNGSNIDGTTVNARLSTNRLNVRFVYIDSTQGWRAIFDDTTTNYGAAYVTATGGTVSTSGDFKIHTFTGDGCFVVSCGGNPVGSNEVSYLVVAGGGGGGQGGSFGGGGGAGGFREGKASSDCYSASPLNAPAGLSVSVQTYPITVGAGGAGHPGGTPVRQGNDGSNSIFSTITSTGGGGGGFYNSGNGRPGGSGGGDANTGPSGTAGSGNTPPVSPPQGNDGGSQTTSYGTHTSGGGGATQVGANGSSGNPGNGGNGATTSISASSTAYAGGGGGGASPPISNQGGSGGGGQGGFDNPDIPGIAGTANTGGGGGGNGPTSTSAGAGGKGIVIIRYKFQN